MYMKRYVASQNCCGRCDNESLQLNPPATNISPKYIHCIAYPIGLLRIKMGASHTTLASTSAGGDEGILPELDAGLHGNTANSAAQTNAAKHDLSAYSLDEPLFPTCHFLDSADPPSLLLAIIDDLRHGLVNLKEFDEMTARHSRIVTYTDAVILCNPTESSP